MIKRFFAFSSIKFWYFLIALLPITSMPFIRILFGSDSVASPSILLLIGLVILWLVPQVIEKKGVHTANEPLGIFMAAAAISSLLSFFIEVPLFKDANPIHAVVVGIGTLMIGFLFFLISSSFQFGVNELHNTFRIINISGLILLLWSMLQAYFWYKNNAYPQWMFEIQGFFSERVLYRNRATGFALEPSWHAHQLNMFYIPFWLSATIFKKSFHSHRVWKFSVENCLLMLGIAALVLTLSRVGWAAFGLMLIILFFIFHQQARRVIKSKIFHNKESRKADILISIALISGYLLIISLAVMVSMKLDPRMAAIFDFDLQGGNPLLNYFNDLKFGDRVIYWLAGWDVFNRHPIMGVGLGNAGFYFPETIPPIGWNFLEVRALMYRSSGLLNIKNFWIRLLAETGLVGFSIFVSWLFFLLGIFIKKLQSKQPKRDVLGLMGIFVLVGFIFEGFSIDSFAMPYLWISLGLAANSSYFNNQTVNKVLNG